MSDKEPFSNREIQLMFKNIELLLVDLKKDILSFNTRIAKLEEKVSEIEILLVDIKKDILSNNIRITRLEEKVVELERFQTKALVLWSVAVVLIGWIVNNFAKFIGV